jgi:hypothetical protein
MGSPTRRSDEERRYLIPGDEPDEAASGGRVRIVDDSGHEFGSFPPGSREHEFLTKSVTSLLNDAPDTSTGSSQLAALEAFDAYDRSLMRFDAFKKGGISWPDPVRKRGNEPRAPGKDASLEEQIAYSAEQKDPNEDLLDYVRGGSPFADSVGRRKKPHEAG